MHQTDPAQYLARFVTLAPEERARHLQWWIAALVVATNRPTPTDAPRLVDPRRLLLVAPRPAGG